MCWIKDMKRDEVVIWIWGWGHEIEFGERGWFSGSRGFLTIYMGGVN